MISPNGEVYYEVPNHPGYVMDITASNATGRKVFRANPKDSIAKQKEEEDRLKKAQDQQAFNQSPAGQLLPVAGGVGGTIAAAQFLKPGPSLVDKALAAQIEQQTAANAAPAVQSATTGVLAGVPSEAAAQGAFFGPGGSATGAGAELAPETAGIGVAPYLGAAGAGLGAYGLYNSIKANDVKGGAISGAGLGLGLGAAAPLLGFGPLGWGALAASAGLGALGGGGLTSLFGHETTRQLAQKHTSKLLGQSDDPNYQNYVQSMRDQYNAAPPDPTKPYHGGQYSSFDEYKRAGLDASDLTGVYGNLKTYGPEWANLTQEQRKAVTQANIDSGLYSSKKGEVEITDTAKALENKNNVLKGFNVGAQTAGQAAAQGATAPNTVQLVPPAPGMVIDPSKTIPVPRSPYNPLMRR